MKSFDINRLPPKILAVDDAAEVIVKIVDRAHHSRDRNGRVPPVIYFGTAIVVM